VVTKRKPAEEGGSFGVSVALKSAHKHRTKVRIAFANHGRGQEAGKPKFHPWMFVDAVTARPTLKDYGVKMSGRPAVFSHRLVFVIESQVE